VRSAQPYRSISVKSKTDLNLSLERKSSKCFFSSFFRFRNAANAGVALSSTEEPRSASTTSTLGPHHDEIRRSHRSATQVEDDSDITTICFGPYGFMCGYFHTFLLAVLKNH
jgi:hypothetical protein